MSRYLPLLVAGCIACGHKRDPGPSLQVLGESTRWRAGDPLPATSPWLVGGKLVLAGARGETLGIQVFHRPPTAATLTVDGAIVRGYAAERVTVTRPSTEMYGGSHGSGEYPDELVYSPAPATDPAYFEIAIARDARPGVHAGSLRLGDHQIPVVLTVATATLPPPRLDVWAYFDQRELGWFSGAGDQPATPVAHAASPAERACIEMFRGHGVLLSPDMTVDAYPSRKALLFGFPHVPAIIPTDPAAAGDAVRAWIAATTGTGQVPFAIPIDEPRTPDARRRLRAVADAVRAAGGGPGRFELAVTDQPRPEYGDAIDLYISWNAAHLDPSRDRPRWTYNGKPPRAGSLVVDTETPGLRSWGWIAHRWRIPVWYVWDALYWHDRHNRHGAPLPGRALDRHDAVTFDDGDDRGNLDGVLAYPERNGCRPSLRLAALRRGLEDRALLELAARCQPDATAKLAARMVPRALGDAPDDGPPTWPTDEAAWESARRELLDLASCGK